MLHTLLERIALEMSTPIQEETTLKQKDVRVEMTNFIKTYGPDNVFISFRSGDFDRIISGTPKTGAYTGLPGLYCYRFSTCAHLFYKGGVVDVDNFLIDVSQKSKAASTKIQGVSGKYPTKKSYDMSLKWMGLGFTDDFEKINNVKHRDAYKYITLFTLKSGYHKFNEFTGDTVLGGIVYNYYFKFSEHAAGKKNTATPKAVNISSYSGKNDWEKLANYYKDSYGKVPNLLSDLINGTHSYTFVDFYYTVVNSYKGENSNNYAIAAAIFAHLGVYVLDQVEKEFLHSIPAEQTLILTSRPIQKYIRLDLSHTDRVDRKEFVEEFFKSLLSLSTGDVINIQTQRFPLYVHKVDSYVYTLKPQNVNTPSQLLKVNSKTGVFDIYQLSDKESREYKMTRKNIPVTKLSTVDDRDSTSKSTFTRS